MRLPEGPNVKRYEAIAPLSKGLWGMGKKSPPPARLSPVSGQLDDLVSEFLWVWWTCSWHG